MADERKKITTCLLATMLTLLSPAPKAQAHSTRSGAPSTAPGSASLSATSTPTTPRRRQATDLQSVTADADPSAAAPELSALQGQDIWDAFYARYNPRVREMAEAYRRRGVDVEECAQDVWLDLIEKLPTFRVDPSRGEFQYWLGAVVRNKAIDQIRRNVRRPAAPFGDAVTQISDTSAGPGEQCESSENQDHARRLVREIAAHVTPDCYRLLHMRHVEGKSVREVAEVLGMTPTNVSVTEHRAKALLRSRISV